MSAGPRIQPLHTDLRAALTRIGLHDAATSRQAWADMAGALAGLEAAGALAPETAAVLARLPAGLPRIFLRRDRGLWQVTLHVVTDTGEIVTVNHAGARGLSAGLRGPAGRVDVPGFEAGPEEERLLERLQARAAEGGGGVGGETVVALWVSRGYDTMRRVGELHRLAGELGPGFRPLLAIHRTGNLLEPSVAVPFARGAERVESPGAWRQALPVERHLVECLQLPHARKNAFHADIARVVQALAAGPPGRRRLPPPDRPRHAVFLSIEAEKRQMTNQRDFFAALLQGLAARYGPLEVLVNGMTGNVEGADQFADIGAFEAAMIADLAAALPGARFTHMHDWTFAEKAVACAGLRFHVSPLGTAMLIPHLLQVPGVAYNAPEQMRQFGWMLQVMPGRTVLMDAAFSRSVAEDHAMRKYSWGWADNSRLSYALEVDPAVAFCLAWAAEQG